MIEDEVQIRRRPVIRVFVSSTFTDLKHERDALQRDVFPKLEQLCATRQFQFQAIDLRWGVPTEASLDHRTMRICFEELRRSQEISPQPNFLILMGNRYGWRPLPEEISEEEFRRLDESSPSTTARQTLVGWYRRDENTVPPVYLLQTRKQNLNDGNDYQNDQVWNGAQRALWDVINQAYPADQLAARFDYPAAPDATLPSIVRFQASATEQEIWRGAFAPPNARQHVLAFVREIKKIEEFSRPSEIRDFVDVDDTGAIDRASQGALRQLKEELRQRLGEANVIPIEHVRLDPSTNEKGEPCIDVTTTHLGEFCAGVHAALEAIIRRQINEYWGTSISEVPSARELELERLEHQRFGQERAPERSFVGREQHLQAIKDYLLNDSHAPLVIHGESGCGKTALLARAAQLAAQDVVPENKPLVRFIGATPRSSDIRSLLASLCQELRQRHPLEGTLPGDVHELARELDEHFNATAVDEPLILFLDALDQLADVDNGRSLSWIPFRPLPDHVKLIVSCLSDRAPEDPAGQPYATLKRRELAEANFINVEALSAGQAETLFFERWLRQAKRKLNDDQARRIRERLGSDACRQPLYLKILFEEARLWRSYDPTPPIDDNLPELLRALFKRLGDKDNHGPTVECALGYIASARRGLTELEILEVLYRDADYKTFLDNMAAKTGHKLPDNPKRIPIAIWSRLRFDLAPYLAEHAAPGGTVLSFYHHQVADYVRGQFLDASFEKQKRHRNLAGYFRDLPLWLAADRVPNSRKVFEQPYQQTQAGFDADVGNTLCDLEFVEAKCLAAMPFDLVRDCDDASRLFTLLDVREIRRALTSALPAIRSRPGLTLQTLVNRLRWQANISTRVRERLDLAFAELDRRGAWLSAEAPLPGCSAEANGVVHFEMHSSLQAAAPLALLVVVVSSDGTAELHDLQTGELVEKRHLAGAKVRGVAIHGKTRSLAYVTENGLVITDPYYGASFAGRAGETHIAYAAEDSIIAVGRDHALMVWDPRTNREVELLEGLPTPLIVANATENERHVLVVAGERSGQQVVVLLERPDSRWLAKRFDLACPPVINGAVDENGEHFLIASRDRVLRVFRIKDGKLLKETAYEQRPGVLFRGPIQRCALTHAASGCSAYFATGQGHVGWWQWQLDRMQRLADYRGPSEHSTLAVLAVLPQTGELFLSTADGGKVVSSALGELPPRHSSAITACSLTRSGKIVSLSEVDQTLRWFSADGLIPLYTRPVRLPTAMTCDGNSDSVVVGTTNGKVWSQPPERTAEGKDIFIAFEDPVVSVASIGEGWALAASKSGRVLRIHLTSDQVDVLRRSTGFRDQHAIPWADAKGNFVSFSVESAGEYMDLIALVRSEREEETILQARRAVVSVSVNRTGDTVCVAAGDGVRLLHRERAGWEKRFERTMRARFVRFVSGDDALAVMLADEPWLELWDVKDGLPTRAAIDVSPGALCIDTLGQRIAVGFQSGRLLSTRLRGAESAAPGGLE